MNPSTLELIIHSHVCPEPHPRLASPAITDGVRRLLHHGLIEPVAGREGLYDTTAKGKAHIEQLCMLPFPEQVYIDYKGDKL